MYFSIAISRNHSAASIREGNRSSFLCFLVALSLLGQGGGSCGRALVHGSSGDLMKGIRQLFANCGCRCHTPNL